MPPAAKYLLFVSSVQRELAAERRAVKDFVEADALLSGGSHYVLRGRK